MVQGLTCNPSNVANISFQEHTKPGLGYHLRPVKQDLTCEIPRRTSMIIHLMPLIGLSAVGHTCSCVLPQGVPTSWHPGPVLTTQSQTEVS